MPLVTKDIGGRKVALSKIDAFESFALQPLLAPAAMQAFGLMLQLAGKDSDGNVDKAIEKVESDPALLSGFMGGIGHVIASFKPADLKAIVHGLLYKGSLAIDGFPVWPEEGNNERFNQVFAGRTRDLWEILFFAVQENYPDFLGGSRAASGEKSKAESPSGTSVT